MKPADLSVLFNWNLLDNSLTSFSPNIKWKCLHANVSYQTRVPRLPKQHFKNHAAYFLLLCSACCKSFWFDWRNIFHLCVCVCVCERKLRNSVYLQHMLRQIRDIFAEPFVFHEEVLQFYVLFVLFSFKLCPCKSKLEECSLWRALRTQPTSSVTLMWFWPCIVVNMWK